MEKKFRFCKLNLIKGEIVEFQHFEAKVLIFKTKARIIKKSSKNCLK